MVPPRRLLVALSGGVDSAVAALSLHESGHEVVAVFMRNGVSGRAGHRSCCSLSDARDARAVAARLGVPFYVHDLSRPFSDLVDAFARDYARGLTPNPCMACNNDLKFGELAELAADLGCDGLATGHYARVREGRLRRAVDAAKDQSYLLAGLTDVQRRAAVFPLGERTKSEVRRRARRAGLPVADKPDSADICFVPGGDYRAVVTERLGGLGRPGAIVDREGRVRGRHAGVAGFTVGQRRGLGVALGEPAYVTSIDPATGRVAVGPAADLGCEDATIGPVLWHDRPPPQRPLSVQMRHHHRPERLRHWRPAGDGLVTLRFETPSRAVCPGQYAVLYDGEVVVAAGRIRRREESP